MIGACAWLPINREIVEKNTAQDVVRSILKSTVKKAKPTTGLPLRLDIKVSPELSHLDVQALARVVWSKQVKKAGVLKSQFIDITQQKSSKDRAKQPAHRLAIQLNTKAGYIRGSGILSVA